MNTIYSLPTTERKHFVQCHLCRDYMDRRNPGEVFHHDTGECQPGINDMERFFSVAEPGAGNRAPVVYKETPVLNRKIKKFLSQFVAH